MTITKTKNPHRVQFNLNTTWLRQFVTVFPPCRARFDPQASACGIVEGKVAIQFSSVSIIPPTFHT